MIKRKIKKMKDNKDFNDFKNYWKSLDNVRPAQKSIFSINLEEKETPTEKNELINDLNIFNSNPKFLEKQNEISNYYAKILKATKSSTDLNSKDHLEAINFTNFMKVPAFIAQTRKEFIEKQMAEENSKKSLSLEEFISQELPCVKSLIGNDFVTDLVRFEKHSNVKSTEEKKFKEGGIVFIDTNFSIQYNDEEFSLWGVTAKFKKYLNENECEICYEDILTMKVPECGLAPLSCLENRIERKLIKKNLGNLPENSKFKVDDLVMIKKDYFIPINDVDKVNLKDYLFTFRSYFSENNCMIILDSNQIPILVSLDNLELYDGKSHKITEKITFLKRKTSKVDSTKERKFKEGDIVTIETDFEVKTAAKGIINLKNHKAVFKGAISEESKACEIFISWLKSYFIIPMESIKYSSEIEPLNEVTSYASSYAPEYDVTEKTFQKFSTEEDVASTSLKEEGKEGGEKEIKEVILKFKIGDTVKVIGSVGVFSFGGANETFNLKNFIGEIHAINGFNKDIPYYIVDFNGRTYSVSENNLELISTKQPKIKIDKRFYNSEYDIISGIILPDKNKAVDLIQKI